MRISDWSSDVCASDLQHFLKVAIADRIATIPAHRPQDHITLEMAPLEIRHRSVRPISAKHAQASRFLQQSRRIYGYRSFSGRGARDLREWIAREAEAATSNEDLARRFVAECRRTRRSEEHTSELQSLMRISYAVFCLKK